MGIKERVERLAARLAVLAESGQWQTLLGTAVALDLVGLVLLGRLLKFLFGRKAVKGKEKETPPVAPRSRKQLQEQGLSKMDLVRNDNGPLVIASDCDGTLFNDNGEVSERTKRALRRFTAYGGTVVLATGNPAMAMKRTVAQLDCTNGCVVCSSGSVVMSLSTWQPLVLNTIPSELAARLACRIQAVSSEVEVAIEGLHRWYVQNDVFFDRLDAVAGGMGAKLRHKGVVAAPGVSLADTFLESDEESAVRVLFIHATMSADDLLRLAAQSLEEEEAGRKQDFVQLEVKHAGVPGSGYFGVKGVHKASALQQVCDLLAVPSNRVTAFGDNHNDLEMLMWAGKGVAVANAVNELKQVASKVLEESNDEDAVAKEIERILDSSDERALMRDNLKRLNDQVCLLESENNSLQKENIVLDNAVAQHENFLEMLRSQSPAPTPTRSLRKSLLKKS